VPYAVQRRCKHNLHAQMKRDQRIGTLNQGKWEEIGQ
jgi:hypothetical protein